MQVFHRLPRHRYALGVAVVLAAACAEEILAPNPPASLTFTTQPQSVVAGLPIAPAVVVTALDSRGSVAKGFTGNVTLALGAGPSGAQLDGATNVAAVAGVAIFRNLSIPVAAAGYTLAASATGLKDATSTAFSVTPPDSTGTKSILVSGPYPTPVGFAARLARAAHARSAGSAVTPSRLAAATSTVAYVALAPGTVPQGVTATISNTNAARLVSVTPAMLDGGFDPVAIPALVGDTLVLVLANSAGGSTQQTMVVHPPINPRVVRTAPPGGKTGVAVNAEIKAVFTEPMDMTTLDTAKVRLWAGGTRVRGVVRPSPDRLAVTFTPDSLLRPNQAYLLTLDSSITSGANLSLGAQVQTGFTTTSDTTAPLVVSLSAVDFGTQPLGLSSAPRTVTLTNTTQAPQPVSYVRSGFTNTGVFWPTTDCPAQLAAGASCTFNIVFTPQYTGSPYLDLVINGSSPQPVVVHLTGACAGGLSLAVVPDRARTVGKFVYVANPSADNLSMYRIDPVTGALTPLVPPRIASGGLPASVAVDPSGKFVYVANFGSNDVSMFAVDATTGGLTPIGSPVPAGGLPASVAVAPDPTRTFGKFVYVANQGSRDVSAYTIDSGAGTLTPIGSAGTKGGTARVAVQASALRAYVATDGCRVNGQRWGNTCVLEYTIDPTTGALAPADTLLTGGATPTSMTIDPSGRFAALTNADTYDVWSFSIDAASGALTLHTFAVAYRYPSAVAIAPSGGFAYVTATGSPTMPNYPGTPFPGPITCGWVAPLEGCSAIWSLPLGADGGVGPLSQGPIAAGLDPTAIAIDPSGRFAYVANSGSQSISMYSIASDGSLTLIGEIGT